ncbi:hypothetical protein [Caballeronia calidae]|uniref:hypothetical protein n=1 Tax=Caballeronia calidae TaxID=1777139 RepID=UPI000787CE1C|nr:hypothetical protein [Caballeronia calidae]
MGECLARTAGEKKEFNVRAQIVAKLVRRAFQSFRRAFGKLVARSPRCRVERNPRETFGRRNLPALFKCDTE